MGRVKLKIKRLESTSNRQVTYSKRRNGILKKAKELSILCDIDIVLLMYSPTGRPTILHGERSNIEEVITKFSRLTPQERAKRKLESLEALKKTFKKLDHDVNIQEFLGGNNETVETMTSQVALMQAQLTEVHRRLRCYKRYFKARQSVNGSQVIAIYWNNVDKIDNIEHLRQMEDSLRGSMDRVRLHKENIRKNQFMSLDCTNQFQNGMALPLVIGGIQEAQSLPWHSNNEHQHHLMLPNESTFLPNREMDTGTSLQGYPGFFCQSQQTEIGNAGLDNVGQEKGALNELNANGGLSSQLSEQYSYPPYGSITMEDDKKLKSEIEMDLHGNSSIYNANSNFELPQPSYNSGSHRWVPATGACGISIFSDNSYN